MDKDGRDVKRLVPWCDNAGLGHLLLAFCVCVLLGSHLANPPFVQSDQRLNTAQSSADQSKGADSKVPAKPHKELPPAQSSVHESQPAQPNTQTSKSDESKTKKESGEEEGAEKGKEGMGRKAVSSLILTVKLALLGDPRLFPYEIEVEAGSDEVTLAGKVSSEVEKAAAADIASTVPTVKSVSNKLEVVKELPELITHKQDDIITHHVKERFAKSATVTAANFDVKTEQGVVSLSGAVRFQVIVLEAVEAAKQVPGVKAVKTDKVRIESEG
jgi:hyperosmotically inducible periplasmic protein